MLTKADYSEELDIAADELIDQYADDALSREERLRMERYFFQSPEKQDKLRFALALKKRRSELVSNKLRRRKLLVLYLPIAASVLVAIGLGAFIQRAFFYQSDLNKGLVALQTAYREQRPVEARISDFTYAPAAKQRGAPDKVDYLQRDRAASLLLNEVAEHPSADSYRALGQYYLARHQFDNAIAQFKSAINLASRDPKTLSDLGAALLEVGKIHSQELDQGKAAQEFAESLGYLNRALELDNSLLEALFNRALLYQYMALLPQAEDDWRRYLEKDPNSKWADEARQNLKGVQEQRKLTSQTKGEVFEEFLRAYEIHNDDAVWRLVSSYYNRMGNIVAEQLLDNYLEDSAQGKESNTDRNLQMLSYVGELEKQRTGDRLFSDLADFYKATTPGQQAILVRARSLAKAAHEGWGQAKVEESFELFNQAKQLFDQGGDKYESSMIEYWLSFCYYRQHKDEQSLTILNPLISACQNNDYKHLLVRALYLLSAVQFNRNEHSKAVESASRSLDLAEQMNDTVGVLNALTSLIEYFRYLGDYAKSLSYVGRSLPLASSISLDPIQGSRLYGFEATAFAASGFYDAAAEYQREALRFAINTGNASVISYNYAFLGIVNGKLQHYSEALKNAQLAYEVAAGHSNEAPDHELMAYALLQMGHINRQAGSCDQAIASYSKSIEISESLNHPTNLYQAHKGRFFCYVAQKNDGLAKEELSTTLKLVEEYRNNIFEESNRANFFDVEQSLYDAGIDFEYSRMNDPRESFRRAEFSRARSLLDLIYSDAGVLTKGREPSVIPRSVSLPLSPDEIVRQLPEQAQVLQYAALKDKLIIWVVSKEGILSTAKEVNYKDLNDKVLGYLRLAASPSENGREEMLRRAKDLFDILIKPVEQWLDPNKQICVVPDKVLSYLPFTALVSSSSGKYLIEDYHLIFSPSSTIFITCSGIAHEKEETTDERLLSVGNPRFDHDAFPSFPDLPAAAKEATDITVYYKYPRSLIGEQAKVRVVKSEMEKSEVIHLALHSSLDERFPLRSKLLLARELKEGGDTQTAESVLYAYEIYGMKLPKSRLVVLSACQTGAEHYYGGEGMISIARPFIAARVPLVIASLWPVDSDSTAELMVSFHKHRKNEGLLTLEALRRAQLEMLHSPEERLRHPYYWAPFVVIGGYAKF